MKNHVKTIVITESTKGIGLGLAYNFLKLGHRVVIHDFTDDSINKALNKLKQISSSVIGFAGDVNNKDFPEELYNYAISSFQKVDIWINNVGIAKPINKIWEFNHGEIQSYINTNITIPTNAMRSLIPLMKKQGFGTILNMEGLESDSKNLFKLLNYEFGKRSIHHLSKMVSKELRKSKVRVGTISLGIALTQMILEPENDNNNFEKKTINPIDTILEDTTETVTPVLVNKILKINTKYPKIEYLAKWKILYKILKTVIFKTALVPEI